MADSLIRKIKRRINAKRKAGRESDALELENLLDACYKEAGL